jgi:hypothetical protein
LGLEALSMTVVLSTAQPVEHALHAPFTQSLAPWHAIPQLPQLKASVFKLTQLGSQNVSVLVQSHSRR